MKIRQTKKILRLRAKARGKIISDKFKLVLKIDPKTGETEPCPFCGRVHIHGPYPGCVVSHCPMNHDETFVNSRGQVFKYSNGYTLELAVSHQGGD